MYRPDHRRPAVTHRAALRAVADLQRWGSARVLQDVEQREPALAEHLLEGLSAAYQRLVALGGDPRATQAAYRRFQAVTLTCVPACLGKDDDG